MATRMGFYEPIEAHLRSDSIQAAVQLIETAREKKKYGNKDRLIYYMDAGMLNHYAGNYGISNQKLELAERSAEELFTKSVSKAALSMVLNDNALDYPGEDFEVLYTNIIKALNYVAMDSLEAAMVEVRRVNIKLDALESKYADAAAIFRAESRKDTSYIDFDYDIKEVRFYNNAFARYISMHLYAAQAKYDDARIDYDHLRQAFELQPHIYPFDMPQVHYHTDSGALLSVVALAGLAPIKESLSLRLRTDKQLNLVQILYDDPNSPTPEYTHFPARIGEDYYFKFSIPQLVNRQSEIGAIRVLAEDRVIGNLNLLEDIDRVAAETFEAKKSWILVRTVARALVKGLAAHKMKEKADDGGLGGWLKKVAIDVVSDVIENADLRSTRFLPGAVYVGDFVVEPGTYDLTIEFWSYEDQLLKTTTIENYTVRERGLNLVQAFSVL